MEIQVWLLCKNWLAHDSRGDVIIFTSNVMDPLSLFSLDYAPRSAKRQFYHWPSVWKKTVTYILWLSRAWSANPVESNYYELQKILRRTLRILLADGRLIEGRLQVRMLKIADSQCFDSALNLIFVNAFEIVSGSAFWGLLKLESHLVHPIGRLIVPASEVRQLQVINWTWSEEREARTQHRPIDLFFCIMRVL